MRNTVFLRYVLVMLLPLAFGGCLQDQFNPPVTDGCDTTYYQREIHPILVTNCTKSSCHDGLSGRGDYHLYLDVKTRVEMDDHGESEFLHRINLPPNDHDHMPKNGPSLSQSDRDKIALWIKNGYQGCDR